KSPKDYVDSLLFASRVADARAFFGKPATIASISKLSKLKISQNGIDALSHFANEALPTPSQRQKFLLNGYFEADDHFVIMVPTSIVKAKSTVGLGDTISSIAFASEPL
ncbi:MAG: ADP-dependent glucokinase/phosphofructokinase, partial [Candidatus Micrarchaeota archaeon]